MTGTDFRTLRFGSEATTSAVWFEVASAGRDEGLDAIAAARLGLAASILVGGAAASADVRLGRTVESGQTRVRVVVRGGPGRCGDIPAGLVDDCAERPVVGGDERSVAVTVDFAVGGGAEPPVPDERPVPDLLTVALSTMERLLRQHAVERAELQAMRVELEETNRGLVAVYAESSDEKEMARIARDHAVEASHAKAEYLANMSHEIRSPLSAVIGFTGLLLETHLTTEQAEYAEAIRAAGNHLRGLVDDVLDLSKIEAGGLVLEDIPFDLITCVEDALGIVTAAAEDKGIVLAALFDHNTPAMVGGDPVRLRQVLVNLLSNAVKFTPEGDVTVYLHAGHDVDGRCRLTVHVRDTGIGIAPDAIERIFVRYAQAEAGTTRTFGGTGLGLAICRELAHLMGGDLTVQSTLGQGSTFTCTAVVRLLEESQPEVLLRDHHVLVVHDHPPTLDTLRRHLLRWGATPTCASTVDDAIEHADAWKESDLAVVGTVRRGTEIVADVERVVATHARGPVPVIAVIPLSARHKLTEPPDHIKATVCTPVRRGQFREAILVALGQPQLLSEHPGDGGPAEEAPASKQVLYVDDDPMLTTLVQRIFANRTDLTLVTVTHGRAAMDLMARIDFDLVLLDLRLPDMTGDQLLRQLRADSSRPQPPVVVLSGDTTTESTSRLLAVGATDYLAKPFTAPRLRDLVAELLDL
jgi:signal transduction histidine kinase/DNA-binding response OmpR family regulator